MSNLVNSRPQLTEQDIKRLKRAAWEDKRERNCSHADALNLVAQENGYDSWAALMHAYHSQADEDLED